MKVDSWGIGKLLVIFIIIPVIISLFNNSNNSFEKKDIINNEINLKLLQNSYAIENKTNSELKIKDKKSDIDYSSISGNNTDIEKNKESNINFVAVGDWDCTEYTKDTVNNIISQDPELVLALGDLSYNGKAQCWLQMIEPFKEKTKIVIGNHEVDSSNY